MEVDNRELTRRIAGRRSCPSCGTVYNIYSMTLGSDLRCTSCDKHSELVQRPDDNEDTVLHRLRVYDEQTRPLIAHYREQGLLRTIDAQAEVDDVTNALVSSLSQPAEAGMTKKAAPSRRTTAAKKQRIVAAAVRRKAAPAKPKRATAKKKPAAKKKKKAAKQVKRKVAKKAKRKVAAKASRKPVARRAKPKTRVKTKVVARKKAVAKKKKRGRH